MLCGWLNKYGNRGFMKTSKRLWFVYSNKTCKFFFYRNPEDLLPLGEIDIKLASFYFDPRYCSQGMFEIRSGDNVYVLDAQNEKEMLFWLEKLQMKRKQFNVQQKKLLFKKTSCQQKSRSGLLCSNSQFSALDNGSNKLATSSESDTHVHMTDNISTKVGSTDKCEDFLIGGWHSEISDASSWTNNQTYTDSTAPITNNLLKKPESNFSSNVTCSVVPWLATPLKCSSASEDCPQAPALTTTATPVSDAAVDNATLPSVSTDAVCITSSSCTRLLSVPRFGGKMARMFGPLKHLSHEAMSSCQPSCVRCKLLQDDLLAVKGSLESTKEELEANQEIVRLLQKELDIVERITVTNKTADTSSDGQKEVMLQRKDKQIVEMEHSMAAAAEQQIMLAKQAGFQDTEICSLKDQVEMLQDMLQAKDDAIVKLTNQIFYLESCAATQMTCNDQCLHHDITTDDVLDESRTKETVLLQDSVKAYEMQNKFLTKEILELNDIRILDEKRENDLLLNIEFLNALYYQTRSKYLFLINMHREPVRGGEENKHQEAIERLLQEALETENSSMDKSESKHFYFPTNTPRYDNYGFLNDEESGEMDDILLVKADQLKHKSDVIFQHIKDGDEMASKQVKWENFMAGQGDRLLVRANELKVLIRMGVPHEYKEHIWKGCINFYVGQARERLGNTYYTTILGGKIKHNRSNPAAKQIELDLLRTLPTNRHFDSIEADGIPKLRRVLLCYSVHNPLIGYCQGLNRIAAVALLFLSEEDSFWCLEAIIQHIMPKEYFTNTLASAQADQRVLKDLVVEKLPRLSAHFDCYDIDLPMYTFNWFLTIFVDNARPEIFLRCWDAFLFEGSKVLFRFALAFLKHSEADLLDIQETTQIYRYMRKLGEKAVNVSSIAQIAFHEINPFPMRAINSKRAHHLQHVLEELRQLDVIRLAFRSNSPTSASDKYHSDDDEDNGDLAAQSKHGTMMSSKRSVFHIE